VQIVLALHDPKSNHGVINFRQRLVVLPVGAGTDEFGNIDDFEGPILDVHVIHIGKLLGFPAAADDERIPLHFVSVFTLTRNVYRP
jgi:hypothetical protein